MSASSQTGWKQRLSKWTTPSGLASIIIFLIILLLIEYLIVASSVAFGLVDENSFTWQIASFTISISPLFHLLPITVIVVLFVSWIHLRKHTATIPHKTAPTYTRQPPPRKIGKVRFKALRRYYKRFSKKLSDIGQQIKSVFTENRIVEYFGFSVVKSALTIILSFIVLALFIYVLAYPQIIPDAANWLLGGGNSAFQGFVTWTRGAATAVGQALSPIGWLAANTVNGLAASSLGFRSAVTGFTTPIVKPIIDLDIVRKYVLIQNIAAWTAALIALFYGQIAHKPVKRTK